MVFRLQPQEHYSSSGFIYHKKKEEYIAVGVCLLKNKGRAREETWRFREDERRNVSQKEETTKR